MEDLNELQGYVDKYNTVKSNTIAYRKAWYDGLRDKIQNQLNALIDATGLPGKVDVFEEYKNLEAVVLNLGIEKSGLGEVYNENTSKDFFKNNGALVYQQLYNGKVSVLINYPVIEGMTQPAPPRTIEILRPEELKEVFILRHVERFLKEITTWEDYDDDNEQTPTIGFHPGYMSNSGDLDGDGEPN